MRFGVNKWFRVNRWFGVFWNKHVWYNKNTDSLFSVKEIESEWAKETKLQKSCYAIRRFFLNLVDLPYNIYYNTKYTVQRVNRGWSDRDAWNPHNYLSIVIPQMLRKLKAVKHGVPCVCLDNPLSSNFSKEEDKNAVAKWDNILDTIIYTFETQQLIDSFDLINPNPYTDEEITKWEDYCIKMNRPGFRQCRVMTKEEVDRYNLGWKYLKDYWGDLWD